MTIEAITYNKHKNLKLAAAELGLCWQTLYSRLKNQGVPVTGDKLRYGTDRDRLGALAEAMEGWLVSDLGCGYDIDEGKCARFAYQMADAMMAERERGGEA